MPPLQRAPCFTPAKHEAPPPPPPPPAAPAEPEPVANERFDLAPDEDVVGGVQIVTASKEDTLTDIARRFNVGYEEILRANPKVDPWLPGAGKPIVVPTQFIIPNAPRTGVVINIAAMRLFYFPPHKSGEPQVVVTSPDRYRQGGLVHARRGHEDRPAPGGSDLARTGLGDKRAPRERRGAREGDRAGPDNPLGKFAFYLQWPSYLIHGTNKPAGVGLRSSHGCIRLYPEDIAQLYDLVPIGTQVRVVNQPFVFGWHEGQLYMQAFDVLEDDSRDWKKASRKLLSKSFAATLQKQLKTHNEQVNWDLVATLTRTPRGVPVPISLADGSVELVLAAAPKVQNHVPDGSTWDGKSDLPMDEATFQQMISEIEPGGNGASTTTPASPAPGPAGTAPKDPPTTNTNSPAAKPHPAGPPAPSAAVSQSKSTN